VQGFGHSLEGLCHPIEELVGKDETPGGWINDLGTSNQAIFD
jgi:hypothetical protein